MIRHVQLKDLGGYLSKIPRERHAAAVKAVRLTLQERGRVIVNEEINATLPRPPVDRRTYANSWFTMAIDDGGRIYSKDPKASIVDRGRRRGFGVGKAGIVALMGWAQRHGMERSAAYAIAAAIKRRGLWMPKGLRVFERASKRIVDACRHAAKLAISGAEFQGSHN